MAPTSEPVVGAVAAAVAGAAATGASAARIVPASAKTAAAEVSVNNSAVVGLLGMTEK